MTKALRSGPLASGATIRVIGYPAGPGLTGPPSTTAAPPAPNVQTGPGARTGPGAPAEPVTHVTTIGEVRTPDMLLASEIPPGLSGGAAVDAEGHVIGLATTEASIVDTATLVAALDRAGLPHAQSATDRNYRNGLDLYRAGRYGGAIAHFDEVRKAGPHPRAEAYRRLAAQRHESTGDRPDPALAWAELAGAIGLLAALAAGLIAMLRPGKPAHHPS